MKGFRLKRSYLLQGLKLSLGALIAVLLAEMLGLRYSATAGVITLLSILGTKRETLRVAAGRLGAYGVSLAAAWSCFQALGYNVAGFAAFLFLFAVICCCAGWMYALSICAVLASHFMAEGGMPLDMIWNETLIFLIGAGVGVMVNLTLRSDERRMQEKMAAVDSEMRRLLSLAADPSCQAEAQMKQLDDALASARRLAVSNCDNHLRAYPAFDLAYVDMRARQREILLQIIIAAGQLTHLPAQHQAVEDFFRRVAEEYRMDNDTARLQAGLADLLEDMKRQPLPGSREEFESRAVLYYMLVRLRDFLNVKGSFHQEYMQ